MKYNFCFIILFLNIQLIKADYFGQAELYVSNHSDIDNLKVSVIPMGVIYRGDLTYRLDCLHPRNNIYSYIYGGSKELPHAIGSQINSFELNSDYDINNSTDAAIGYGKYIVKIEKKDLNNNYFLVDFCYVDYSDADYPYSQNGFIRDIEFDYYSETDIRCWDQPLPTDREIKIWDQRLRNSNAYKLPNKNFISVPNSVNLWRNYPIVSEDYGGPYHIQPGNLFTFLSLQNNVTINLKNSETFIIEPNLYL